MTALRRAVGSTIRVGGWCGVFDGPIAFRPAEEHPATAGPYHAGKSLFLTLGREAATLSAHYSKANSVAVRKATE